MLKHIPNALTVVRLLLIPFISIAIFQEKYIAAFIIFTLSGLTDILDGCIARKFNVITNFGKLIDPLADKLTQLTVITSLVIIKIIPEWILLIVFSKELIMMVGAAFLYGKDIVVYSRWYGKLATVLFYLAIVISLLTSQFEGNKLLEDFDIVLYALASIVTIFALFMYVKVLLKKDMINRKDLSKEVMVEKKEKHKKQDK